MSLPTGWLLLVTILCEKRSKIKIIRRVTFPKDSSTLLQSFV